MSSVKLNYSAAKEAAEKLFNSVSKIGESMEKLDRALKSIVSAAEAYKAYNEETNN